VGLGSGPTSAPGQFFPVSRLKRLGR
jgi:hypothetical protein